MVSICLVIKRLLRPEIHGMNLPRYKEIVETRVSCCLVIKRLLRPEFHGMNLPRYKEIAETRVSRNEFASLQRDC